MQFAFPVVRENARWYASCYRLRESGERHFPNGRPHMTAATNKEPAEAKSFSAESHAAKRNGRKRKGAGKVVEVVIETPKGHRNKFKYDPEKKCYRLGSVLPAGASFPYDFGFLP